MQKRTAVILVLLVLIFTFQVIAADFPVTVVDDLGFEVTLEKKPERIISLAPSHTEILFALGLEREIVGVTTYANYPEAALSKEKIGSIIEPNIEKIFALNPDLIIAAGINKVESLDRLKELGLKVAGFEPTTVNDIFLTFKKLGKLTGKNELARDIVTKLYIDIAEIQNLVDQALKSSSQPRVFYEIWSDPFYTAGKDTFIDDVITLAGGINIGRKLPGAWPQYSLEMLLIENPDVYISSPHSAPHQVTPESVMTRDNFNQIKAIKNGRVYIIDQDILNRPSQRIVEGLKQVTRATFPQLAEEIGQIE
jgi:iron complex transport system substrate-binding protein